MRRAAIYVRVSSERQAGEDRVSPAVQLEDCRELARAKGYNVVAEILDVKRYRSRGGQVVQPSGTRRDRPGYLRLLDLARRGEIDVIIAWKEDRLFRGLFAAMPLAEVLEERGDALQVELVKDVFDRKMLGIKASIAKLEIDNIRERMVRGRQARLERGELPGGPVKYGYRRGADGKAEVEPEEAEAVRQIFAWYLEGLSLSEIRRRLNASPWKPRKGKTWSRGTLMRILYLGEFYATGRYTTTLDGRTYVIELPPILDADTWRRAVERRKANKTWPARNVKRDYLCQGLVTCPCGWTWNARTVKYKGRNTRAGYYTCPRREHAPEAAHPECGKSIGSGKLDSFVWRYVKGVVLNPDVLRAALDQKIAALERQQGDIEADARAVERELERLAEERQWVIRQGRKGLISEEDVGFQLAELEFQRLALERRLADLQAATDARQQAEALRAWAEEFLGDLRRGLALLDTPAERLWRELDPERLEAVWRELEADRYLDRFDGDRERAFAWAHLEARRRLVRTLVRRVVVRRLPDGSKAIEPEIIVDLPLSRDAILSSGHSSFEYIEEVRPRAVGD